MLEDGWRHGVLSYSKEFHLQGSNGVHLILECTRL